MKQEQYFYKCLYRAIIVKYTKGKTNSSHSLYIEDKKKIAVLFRKVKFIYLKVLSYEETPNKYLARTAMFVFINKIRAKSITTTSYGRRKF